jgi:glucokinase
MNEIAIGIDIGGTNSRFGIVTDSGKVLKEDRFPTKEYPKAEDYVKALSTRISGILEDYKDYAFKGIGIGAPNGNFFKGTIEQAPNLPWKGFIPLVDLFKQHFDVHIVLTNDANAAAIGEKIFGGAKNIQDFILITLGTGLGSGIVVNGDLVYGHDGFAGEMGHTTLIIDGGRLCGCGKRGCLETYASAQGIKRTVSELLASESEPSLLRDYSFSNLTSEHIYEAAKSGDQIALQAFDLTGKYLGIGLADAVAYTSPEAIFIYGGLAKSGKYILDPTRKYFKQHVLSIFEGKTSILLSKLSGKHGAILGSAALVWKERK